MNDLDLLSGISLPELIRTLAQNHLAHLVCAEDQRNLDLAVERAEGFIEGLDAARVLKPAIIDALYMAVDRAARAREAELAV
ncbi:hypothetical protein CCU68_29365 [Pseudomonas gingeri NCPPB 3146 = LMG 5327]|uniref:Uncharacterized protein n=2 Tax=Pseudomonas gingeri TaxID=117681 RepID=A0A7Y7Y247_9PSED|nr:hypothetical protein [Pseudomonas gingeri]NWC16176.1 hypothetical protein [Pseudomonas gingeri]PNQ89018.1 hypothetical protein CCU68_29365 [Pseudomonas gingeri NCPPB 3146 = LMG 5327]